MAQLTILFDPGPVFRASTQNSVILVLLTYIILNDRVASDAFLSCGLNTVLIILCAGIHDDVGTVGDTIDSHSAEADIVALDLGPGSFGHFYAWSHHVRNTQSQH